MGRGWRFIAPWVVLLAVEHHPLDRAAELIQKARYDIERSEELIRRSHSIVALTMARWMPPEDEPSSRPAQTE